METREPYARDNITHDIDTAWDAISAATFDDQLQAKNWDNWIELFSYTLWYPYLQDISVTIQ